MKMKMKIMMELKMEMKTVRASLGCETWTYHPS